MSRYATAEAFRAALEARLAARSQESGLAIGRLRRRVVFERILVRLGQTEPSMWVLKGGMALEVRLPGRARATKDLDVVTRFQAIDGAEIRERLAEELDFDGEGDRFRFLVSRASDLEPDEAGRPGWRLTVTAQLAGRVFDSVRLDVVARPQEVGATERLPLPNSLAFDEFPGHEVEVVSPSQHFAEKLHALTRDYGRENTRTRDLVDLVLLIENDLVTSGTVMPAVQLVFRERRAHGIPTSIPDVPASWGVPYSVMARELDVEAQTVEQGVIVVRQFWARAATPPEEGRDG